MVNVKEEEFVGMFSDCLCCNNTELQWRVRGSIQNQTDREWLAHKFTNIPTYSHMWMEVIRVEQSWKIKVGRKCWKHKFGKWPHKHPVPSPSCTLSLSVRLMVSRALSLHFSLCHCFTMISVCFSSVLLWDVNEEHQTIPHLPARLSPTVSPAWLHTLFIWSSYGLHSPLLQSSPKLFPLSISKGSC